jgi:hypothetical protein
LSSLGGIDACTGNNQMTQSSSGDSPSSTSLGSAGGGYCTACGTAYVGGQSYCGRCGSRLTREPQTGGQFGDPATASAPAGDSAADPAGLHPADDSPYSTGATFGAVLASIFVPFIALLAALVLRSQERRPLRRQFLRNWAIGSAVWLCTGWLIPIIAFSAASPGASGCQGGIDQLVPPSYQSSDDVHWQATYTCMNGGTETKSVPSSQVPGG